MNNNLEKLYKASGYIILAAMILINFVFQALVFDLTITQLVTDMGNILHIVFSTSAQVMTVGIAYDKGLDVALDSKEFKEADKINNECITYFNQHPKEVIEYLQVLNDFELETIQNDYKLGIGKIDIEKFTPKELERYNELKPKVHTGDGLNKSLYHENATSKRYSYNATANNFNKGYRMIKKGAFAFLIAMISVAPNFIWGNLAQSLSSTLILGGGMFATYLMNFNAPIITFTKRVPKLVDNKYQFMLGLKDYIAKKPKTVGKVFEPVEAVEVNNDILQGLVEL